MPRIEVITFARRFAANRFGISVDFVFVPRQCVSPNGFETLQIAVKASVNFGVARNRDSQSVQTARAFVVRNKENRIHIEIVQAALFGETRNRFPLAARIYVGVQQKQSFSLRRIASLRIGKASSEKSLLSSPSMMRGQIFPGAFFLSFSATRCPPKPNVACTSTQNPNRLCPRRKRSPPKVPP